MRLKELRESKGLSQADLAKVICIAGTSVGNYERGNRAPDAETLIKYADFFNVSIDYILGRSNVYLFEETDIEGGMVSFGERLKKLRASKNMKQEDLSEMLSTVKSTISNYESNRSFPSFENLIKISNIFNVSTDYLTCKSESPNQLIRSDNKEGLTEDEKSILDDTVNAWNKFAKLERYHPSELQEFATAIHHVQHLLGMRILNREHPEIFPKK